MQVASKPKDRIAVRQLKPSDACIDGWWVSVWVGTGSARPSLPLPTAETRSSGRAARNPGTRSSTQSGIKTLPLRRLGSHPAGQRLPALGVGPERRAPKVLVEVEQDLECVARTVEGAVDGLLLEGRHGLGDAGRDLGLGLLARERHNVLQQLVRGEREAELRRRPEDARGAALEEGLEALLLPDGLGCVPQARVRRVTLARLDLQARLDDVARRGQVRGGHAGDGARREELEDAELLGLRLAEEVLLQVGVGREVDGREGHITEQARRRALVQTDQTEVADDPDGRPLRRTLDALGHLALDLKTDLDDFERVGEDLRTHSQHQCHPLPRSKKANLRLGNHRQHHQQESHGQTRCCPACR